MNSTTSKLFQATLLLVLASAGSLAQSCDYQLSHNADGSLTRLQVGDKYALIQTPESQGRRGDAQWTGYVKNSETVTVTNQTGSTELPEGEQSAFEELSNQQVDGIEVSSQSGNVVFDPTNGKQFNVKFNGTGSYKIGGPATNGRDVVTFVANGSDFGYSTIFFTAKSAVILVDSQCNEIKVSSMDQLDADLQKFLWQGMTTQWFEDRRGGPHGRRGPKGPKGPRGGPGGPGGPRGFGGPQGGPQKGGPRGGPKGPHGPRGPPHGQGGPRGPRGPQQNEDADAVTTTPAATD